MRHKKHAAFLGVSNKTILAIAAFICISFVSGVFFERYVYIFKPITMVEAKKNSPELGNNLPVSQLFNSTQMSFQFTLYKMPGKDFCAYTLSDRHGKTIDVVTLLGVGEVPCTLHAGKIESGFQKWVDDSKFLMQIGRNVITVDAVSETATLR